MAYIRVDVTFPREEKLRQLARDLGLPVVYAAAHINWLWLAVMEKPENRFDGNMDGWTDEVIADFAGWPGEAKKFVNALLACGRPKKDGFIEDRDGIYFLHEWKKWQGPGLLNKQESERAARLDKAKVREATKGATREPAAAGDDTVVRVLLNRMKECNVTGGGNQKREHIAAWRARGIAVPNIEVEIMGNPGLGIFELDKLIVKKYATNGTAVAAADTGKTSTMKILEKWAKDGDAKDAAKGAKK